MKSSIKEIAGQITSILKKKNLKDITIDNLIKECKLKNDEDLYLGLELLAKENKILILVTPADTYVLPVSD